MRFEIIALNIDRTSTVDLEGAQRFVRIMKSTLDPSRIEVGHSYFVSRKDDVSIDRPRWLITRLE